MEEEKSRKKVVYVPLYTSTLERERFRFEQALTCEVRWGTPGEFFIFPKKNNAR